MGNLMTFPTRRRFILLLIDVKLIFAAGVLAVALRDNLEFSTKLIAVSWVQLTAIIAASAFVILLAGLERSMLRCSSSNDDLMSTATCFFIVAAAALVGLTVSRFEGVAYSIPIVHYTVATFLLIGAGFHPLLSKARAREELRRDAILSD